MSVSRFFYVREREREREISGINSLSNERDLLRNNNKKDLLMAFAFETFINSYSLLFVVH